MVIPEGGEIFFLYPVDPFSMRNVLRSFPRGFKNPDSISQILYSQIGILRIFLIKYLVSFLQRWPHWRRNTPIFRNEYYQQRVILQIVNPRSNLLNKHFRRSDKSTERMRSNFSVQNGPKGNRHTTLFINFCYKRKI